MGMYYTMEMYFVDNKIECNKCKKKQKKQKTIIIIDERVHYFSFMKIQRIIPNICFVDIFSQ